MPGSSLVVWAYSPGLQSHPQSGEDRHPTLCSGVQVVKCGYYLLSWGTLPWGIGQKLALVWQSLSGPFGVGTFTSFDHQAGVSTWWVCHLTHSWGSSKGGSSIAEWSGSSPLPPGDFAPDRNSCRCGSKAGRFPKSPPADWDQSTVSSELPDNEKQSSPSMAFVRSTVTVVSFKSLDGEGEWCPSTRQDLSANLRVISSLESKLGSLKLTLHLGCTGLGKAAHLLPASSSEAAHIPWLLHHLLLLECPLFLGCHLVPKHRWLRECSWLWHCTHEVEQWRHSICPSSIAAVVNTHSASFLDYCCQVWKELSGHRLPMFGCNTLLCLHSRGSSGLFKLEDTLPTLKAGL